MVDYTDTGIDPESGLTLKERLACDYYLTHLNETRAYREAGYKAATFDNARQDANALFNRPYIRSWLDVKMQERAERLEVSADRALLEAAVVAYASVGDYQINVDTGSIEVKPGVPKEALRAVSSVEVTRTATTRGVGKDAVTTVTWTGKFRMCDKLRSLELLCRHLGLTGAELPPLEVLLNRLPPKVGNMLRTMLAGPGRRPEGIPAAAPPAEGTL